MGVVQPCELDEPATAYFEFMDCRDFRMAISAGTFGNPCEPSHSTRAPAGESAVGRRHGSCRKCDYDNNSEPGGRCNGCINGGGSLIYIRESRRRENPVLSKAQKCHRTTTPLLQISYCAFVPFCVIIFSIQNIIFTIIEHKFNRLCFLIFVAINISTDIICLFKIF
jgi:hypothetical protein